jgi:hypothetical protein
MKPMMALVLPLALATPLRPTMPLAGATGVPAGRIQHLSPAELEDCRACLRDDTKLVVHFHQRGCSRCRLTRSRFERLAHSWHEGSVRFVDVLMDMKDPATQQLAASEGIETVPAMRVFGNNAAACSVSCAPRGTGRAPSLEHLRAMVDECCAACRTTQPDPLAGHTTPASDRTTPAGDLIFAALPVSIAYVLLELTADISAEMTLAAGISTEVATEVEAALQVIS